MTGSPPNSTDRAMGLRGCLFGAATTFVCTLVGIVRISSTMDPAIDPFAFTWIFWFYVFPAAVPAGAVLGGFIGFLMPRLALRLLGDDARPDIPILTSIAGAVVGLIISFITTSVVANWIRGVL